ncbi:MAG TPA: sigma-70 family RNA polymerase sigma factor [Planctomycetota bacterium]|nr:sigma-70 family RNA polymerase sigma factor [Planctomycetota bacterium]
MKEERSEADRLFRVFARSGDPRALGEVYDLLAPDLLRVAMHATRDTAEAEDVLQATFVAAIDRVKSFDHAQAVMPWLVGILGLEARKARERAARQPDPQRVEQARAPDPTRDAEWVELLAELDAALERVPAAFRPVLRLRLRHGLTVPEIAAALERPSGTVRSQLARGTDLLRRSLPVGLAGALALVATPARGLGAVRAALVDHAALAQVSLSAGTLIQGMLAMKKLIAAAVVLIAALLLWNELRPEASVSATGEVASVDGRIEPPASAPSESAERSSQDSAREAVELAPVPAPMASAAPEASALVVHALWPDGTPAAGEIVLAMAPNGRVDDPRVLVTQTDGAARFTEAEPGYWHVWLLRGGQGSTRVRAGAITELTLTLAEGVEVEGRVVDARGQPVGGASIQLSERYRSDRGYAVLRSDAQGAFHLRCVGPDRYLSAVKRGYAPSLQRSVRGGPGERVKLELRLDKVGGSLTGVVEDVDGAPIANALILAGTERPAYVRTDSGSSDPEAAPQRAHSDEHGRFEIEALAPGLQPLQARAVGFSARETSVEVIEGLPGQCRVTLEREAKVVGRVLNVRGLPQATCMVYHGSLSSFASVVAYSGPDGRFEIAGLPSERVQLVAEHPTEGQAAREFDLDPGEVREWQIQLVTTPHISGQLLDSHGEPRAGLIVALLGGDEEPSHSSESNDEGRFDIRGLARHGYRLNVLPDRGWSGFPLLQLDDVWPDGAPLILRLPGAESIGRITAEVATADGTPLTGAELQVWHVELKQWLSFRSRGARGSLAEDIPPGTVKLELRHSDHSWKHLGEHRIEGGTTLDLGTIQFDESGKVHAHLTGAGQAVALRAMIADTTHFESGVARIAEDELWSGPLAPGTHTLMLSGEGVRQVRREFQITAGKTTELELSLEACGVRTIAFTPPPGGAPPKWIACSLMSARDGLVWNGNADCASSPPVARVSAPPGTYTLYANGEGDLHAQTELAIADLRRDETPLAVPLARKP